MCFGNGVEMKFPKQVVVAAIPVKQIFEFPSEICGNGAPRGIDGRLLLTLSEALKFKYKLLSPVDKEVGRNSDGGNWTGLIGMVSRGEADLGITYTAITGDRSEIVDFSVPYSVSAITFAAYPPKILPKIYACIYPFDFYVWLFIFFLLFVIPLIMYKLFKGKFSYYDLVFEVFASLLGKSILKNTFGKPHFFLPWRFIAMVIALSFAAVMTSFLFVPLFETSLRDFKDLAKAIHEAKIRAYTIKGSVALILMQQLMKDDLSYIAEKIMENNWQVPIDELFEEESYSGALIHGITHLELWYGVPPFSVKFISKDSFIPLNAGIAVNKNFCCKHALDFTITRIFEAGLHRKFMKDEAHKYWLSIKDTYKEQSDDGTPLSINDVSGAFIILVSGYCVSIIVLLLEILYNRLTKR